MVQSAVVRISKHHSVVLLMMYYILLLLLLLLYVAAVAIANRFHLWMLCRHRRLHSDDGDVISCKCGRDKVQTKLIACAVATLFYRTSTVQPTHTQMLIKRMVWITFCVPIAMHTHVLHACIYAIGSRVRRVLNFVCAVHPVSDSIDWKWPKFVIFEEWNASQK